MHPRSKIAIVLIACFSSFYAEQASALCARCEQIEEDRAREQALHPHKVGYYEDEMNLAEKNPSSFGKTAQNMNSLPSSENSTLFQKQMTPLSGMDQSFPYDGQISTDTPSENQKKSYTSSFSTVAAILKTKDLLPALKGPFTLFIPSNEALRQLPPGTLQKLLRPENREKLALFVSNHVVPVKLDKASIKNTEIKNLNGNILNIIVAGDSVSINGAKIVHDEPLGENGMLFVIDKTIAPQFNNGIK